jgi:hypothetical protein
MMPDLEEPLPLPPFAPCPVCGGRRFWLSGHDALWICEACHAPECEDLVDAEYEVGGRVHGSCPCNA